MVRHPGCINRIRAKNFGDKVLAANWSERAEVHIWDLEEQLKATHDRQSMNNFIHTKQKNIKPVFTFSGYRNEGYALDWSDVQPGEQNYVRLPTFVPQKWENGNVSIRKLIFSL